MRDKIKDKEYFDEHIKRRRDLIIRGENNINNALQNGSDLEDMEAAFILVSGIYSNLLDGLYSSGGRIEEIKEQYSKKVDYEVKTWSLEKGSGYLSLLKTISLAVLLNAEKEEVEKIKELLLKENVKDYLIDYMMNYLDSGWEVKTDELMFQTPFSKLKKVTKCEDKKEAVDMLKNYLEKDWYKGHKSAGWYDSHNKDEKKYGKIYSGYWSYEAGAVSKIMELEDEDMREQQYYPYDMVHFEG